MLGVMSAELVSRRDMLKTLGGLAGVGFLSRLSFGQDGSRPNIIFINSDDHAQHALSCYGSRILNTPQFDRLASEGMRFDNSFVITSLCAPSRATVLTGKYPHLHGQTANGDTFNSNQNTYPQLLRAAGYQTGYVGKWHLGSDPVGFDYWEVLPGQGAYFNPRFYKMGETVQYNGYCTDIITERAFHYLDNVSQDQPFFLNIGHKAPHRSWLPPSRYRDLFEDMNIPEPETLYDDHSTRSTALKHINMHLLDIPEYSAPGDLSQDEKLAHIYQQFIKQYIRTVTALDENIGWLLDYLDDHNLTENTVVIYTADNGLYLGDHGWYKKSYMYEEALKVPLIVRCPGEVPPGSVSDDFVLNLDIGETILDYAGVIAPSDMQGRSFRPLLRGGEVPDWRNSMYYHFYSYGPYSSRPNYGIRTERYKLINYYEYDQWDDEWELFDLERDPHELHNLYGDPEYAEVQSQLIQELNRLRIQYGESPVSPEVMEVEDMPAEFALVRNYPNPFNNTTTIEFTLPERTDVSIRIFNTKGEVIRTLVNTSKAAGKHTVRWNGRSNAGEVVSSGMYLCKMISGKKQSVLKLTLVK